MKKMRIERKYNIQHSTFNMSDKHILKGPSIQAPISNETLGIRLYRTLKELAKTDKIAFVNTVTNDSISYKSLFDKSIKVATVLNEYGLAGKIVDVFSENSTEYFVAVIAGWFIGSIIATLNPEYSLGEIHHSCQLVKPSAVFCSNRKYFQFKTWKQSKSIKYVHHIWTVQHVLKLYNTNSTIINDFNFLNIPDINTNDVIPKKEDVALLLFSSGTTGFPKAVAITHANINYSIRQSRDRNHLLFDLKDCLITLPFYHIYGILITLLPMLKGNEIKFMEKFDRRLFLQSIETYKIAILSLVPPLMAFLAKDPLVDQYNLKSVKRILCGAANCSQELENAVCKRLNNNITVQQGLGMTEAMIIISKKIGSPTKPGSVGTVECGVEIKFRDPESHESSGPNKVGEICVRSDSVMKGYYGNPKATRDAITSDGWYLTGDLGFYDDDGFVFMVDRIKELIKFKAFQVPPVEIEALLCAHPKILDAAVVGLPDESAGELPLAFVVKEPGVELDEQEIKDFIRNNVSYSKQLHGGIRFVEEISKSASGKILRRELRAKLKLECQKSKL